MTDRLRLSCSDVDDLAARYVLDALGAAEAAAVAAHLAAHAARHPSFAELAGVTPFLAESIDPVAPPPDLRARVMGAIAATPQAVRTAKPAASPAPAAAPAWPTEPSAVPPPTPSVVGEQGPAPVPAPMVPAAAAPTWAPSSDVERTPSYVAAPDWTRVPAEAASAPVSLDAARERRARRSPIRVEMAAAAVIDKINQGGWNVLLQQQRAESDRRLALLSDAVAAAGQPGAAVAPMTGSDLAEDAGGFAVFPPGETGYIVLTGLPAVAADQTWQAWTIADAPASVGLVTIGADGLAVLEGVAPIPGTTGVALTVEPAGGSQAPTMNPVVVGQLGTPLAWTADLLAVVS